MAEIGVEELARADDERARLVADALALRRRNLDSEERADVERIEARRERLSAERRPVEIRFYDDDGGWRSRSDVLGEVCRRASAHRRKAMTLYGLVRGFAPKRALEMGTCVGISGAYQGMALRHGVPAAHMVALDGAPDLAAVAAETFAHLGLDQIEVRVGPFRETLPPVLDEGTVDYAFIDGHHDEEATLDYAEQLLPRAPSALLVFDDIRWTDGMLRAWRRIAADPRIELAVDLGGYGVAFTAPAPR